jgi:hypothetical protein
MLTLVVVLAGCGGSNPVAGAQGGRPSSSATSEDGLQALPEAEQLIIVCDPAQNGIRILVFSTSGQKLLDTTFYRQALCPVSRDAFNAAFTELAGNGFSSSSSASAGYYDQHGSFHASPESSVAIGPWLITAAFRPGTDTLWWAETPSSDNGPTRVGATNQAPFSSPDWQSSETKSSSFMFGQDGTPYLSEDGEAEDIHTGAVVLNSQFHTLTDDNLSCERAGAAPLGQPISLPNEQQLSVYYTYISGDCKDIAYVAADASGSAGLYVASTAALNPLNPRLVASVPEGSRVASYNAYG